MKKLWMVFAACLLMLSLAACGKKDDKVDVNDTNDTGVVENEEDTTTDMDGTDESADSNTDTDMTVENADAISDAVTELDEVDHANVLKMNDGAYVGATLTEGTESSKELEDKIADKAKEAGAENKVYVSTNPDFTKQIDEYSDKIRDGEPVEGLFTEIGDAMKRMFPDAH